MGGKKPAGIIVLTAILVLLMAVSSLGPQKLSPEKYMSFSEDGSFSMDWDRLTKALGGSKKVYRFFEERYPLLMPDTAAPDTMSASWLLDIYTGYSEPADKDTCLQYYYLRPHWSRMDTAEIEEYFGIRLEPYIRREHY